MRYPVLTQENAAKIINARRSDGELDSADLVQWKGEGEDFNKDNMIEELYKALSELKSKYPMPLRTRDPAGGSFEAEACVLIHKRLILGAGICSDLDFWTYLSVIEFPDIIEWRYGDEGKAAVANYGIGNRPENLMYRLWLRAELVALPVTEKKYELAKRGDIDLWRSHLIRQRYANCRKLARELVRFQYPDSNPSKATLTNQKIRELVKRLKRINANMIFSFLDEAKVAALIRQEASLLG